MGEWVCCPHLCPLSVGGRLQEGSLLEVEGMSESGPFYHPAGIKGGAFRGQTCSKKWIVVMRPRLGAENYGLNINEFVLK